MDVGVEVGSGSEFGASEETKKGQNEHGVQRAGSVDWVITLA